MNSKSNFITGTSEIYHLAGNDWYAVEQDDEKVMLVDTDCKVSGEELRTPWTYAKYAYDKDADNGQCILNYANSMVDKYFSSIKHAIIPRDVDCVNEDGAGRGELRNAFMWAISENEFKQHKDIAGAISQNVNDWIWTRTFNERWNERWNDYNCAWCVDNSSGVLNNNFGYVTHSFAVAPAFYLSKAAIDHIAEDGEIILEPVTAKGVKETLPLEEKKAIFEEVLYSYVMADVLNFCEDNDINQNIKSIAEKVAAEFAYKGNYDCNLSYWDNIGNLVKKSIDGGRM